ncbi:MarR family winged helix-turn-helix transcriptional regulator [Streptomyces sp. H39-C1]|uniref:MarR family winged helix-turn-helix transcriptional regulator n=1 Tax=Streptomyces sp. H39-C1 TaxID=3004355 RepID=UPI0022AED8D5|nr:MarR family transcriptional regulator [Streptomyces sp. H39-C1]MCZ4101055.1 MarR family transcriptional regulator [Streptomyces sp. H39-C1]
MAPKPTAASLNDSVAGELASWIAEMPRTDPRTEAARQRIGRLARIFDRLLVRIAEDNDLSAGDWAALSALQRSGPPHQASPTELARRLDITSGTMSVRLIRLTRAGLIEPSPAPDGRSRPVRLTAQGQERWRAATQQRTAAEHQLLTDEFSDAELDRLNVLLGRLLGRLESNLGQVSRHDMPEET